MKKKNIGGFLVKVGQDGKHIKVSEDGENYRVAKTHEVISICVAIQERNNDLVKQIDVAKKSKLVRFAFWLALKVAR